MLCCSFIARKHSGKIRYLEFLAAALGVMDEAWLSEPRLKDAFSRMDVDGTGTINSEDLKNLLGRDYKVGHTTNQLHCLAIESA